MVLDACGFGRSEHSADKNQMHFPVSGIGRAFQGNHRQEWAPRSSPPPSAIRQRHSQDCQAGASTLPLRLQTVRLGNNILHNAASQKYWRYPPLLTILCNHRNRFAVVFGDDAVHQRLAIWLKRNLLANAEIKHMGVGPHLAEKLQASDDSVIQIDQLGFIQFVDVNFHNRTLSRQSKSCARPGWQLLTLMLTASDRVPVATAPV